MTNLIVREAAFSDLSALLELEQKIIDSERPYDQFLKENDVAYYDIDNLISDSDSQLVVAESSGRLVGSGYAQIRMSKSCHLHKRHCYLGFIFVEQEYRGQGVAKMIMDTLTDWGTSSGIHHFHLDVYAENLSAIRAYEKAGFNKSTVKMELVI